MQAAMCAVATDGSPPLALVSPEAWPRKVVAEMEFHSAGYKGIQPIVEAFLTSTGGHATAAAFGGAGGVLAGGRARDG